MIDMLQAEKISVTIRKGIHQKYSVIDKTVVWYGSINFISFGKSEESIMRFESPDIAGELRAAAQIM